MSAAASQKLLIDIGACDQCLDNKSSVPCIPLVTPEGVVQSCPQCAATEVVCSLGGIQIGNLAEAPIVLDKSRRVAVVLDEGQRVGPIQVRAGKYAYVWRKLVASLKELQQMLLDAGVEQAQRCTKRDMLFVNAYTQKRMLETVKRERESHAQCRDEAQRRLLDNQARREQADELEKRAEHDEQLHKLVEQMRQAVAAREAADNAAIQRAENGIAILEIEIEDLQKLFDDSQREIEAIDRAEADDIRRLQTLAEDLKKLERIARR